MSDQQQNPQLPTPKEVEDELIKRELELQKSLDGHAQFFALYIHRFQEQLKYMSKKQLVRVIFYLAASDFNEGDDIIKLNQIVKNLNLNSLRRTLSNVLEFPLAEKDPKTHSKQEKAFFDLLLALLTNKYVGSIEEVIEKNDQEALQREDVVKHKFDVKTFNKRDQVEKDAFATANQLLLAKALMQHYTMIEYLKENGEELKIETKPSEGESNG